MNSYEEVGKVMSANVITINGNSNLLAATELFEIYNIHHLPVVNDEGSLRGIISQTDIDRIKVGATLFRNPQKEDYDEALLQSVLAYQIMTRNVTELQPDDSIKTAYNIFKKNKFRAIPIVGKGVLLGIITPLDILDYFFN